MKQIASVKSMALVMLVAMLALFAAACTGETGQQGARGPAGAAGSTGPAGPEGPAGPAGPEGPAGPAGNDATGGSTGTSIMLDKFEYEAATDKDNNVEFTIYGVGFLPNERVEIELLLPGRTVAPMLSTTADGGGAFVHTTSPFFTMLAEADRGRGGLGHYAIIATGFTSGNVASANLVLVESKSAMMEGGSMMMEEG